MWGTLIASLLGKMSQKNQTSGAAVNSASQTPDLSSGQGFQVAKPQAASGGSGLGGVVGSVAGRLVGGSGSSAADTGAPGTQTDLGTSDLGGAQQSVDPATGKPTSNLTGFAGLKTKLY